MGNGLLETANPENKVYIFMELYQYIPHGRHCSRNYVLDIYKGLYIVQHVALSTEAASSINIGLQLLVNLILAF